MIKGRNCTIDYILKKDWAKNENFIKANAIYIVGGLYGNYYALKNIKEKAKKEEAKIIFNGDIHWFDINEEDFLRIENLLVDDIKLLGNVEYELIKKENFLGCGCNYPEYTSDGIVERSNIIHSIMKENIKNKTILNEIKKRDKTFVVNFHGKKIAITHGDEKNMAGWDCSINNLKNKDRINELSLWFIKNKIDILATTHTCLPVVKKINSSYIFNNGSSGMSNIKKETYGLIIRISKTPSKSAVIVKKLDDLFIELVKIDFECDKFLLWFDKVWVKNSPAEISYRNRIINGTNLKLEDIDLDR